MRVTLLIIVFAISFLSSFSQHKCKSHVYLQESLAHNPDKILQLDSLEERFRLYKENNTGFRGGADLTIPVIVHVLWNTPEQNISDEQILSQITALNEDFNLLNFDAPDVDHPFYLESDASGIEFCLAQQDPFGEASNGINRVWTPVPYWAESNEQNIKITAQGGVDNWDPEHYLNIWVATFDSDYSTLGYATFPGDLESNPQDDGVVIRSNAFGFTGTVTSPNDLGRTGTHEVGHWLNLRHIWGDETCGDDFVDDTPPHYDANYSCPSFPHNSFSVCGTDEYGEMYMNYMDYVDDNCMNLFSAGQVERMWWAIEDFRFELFNSIGCEPGIPSSVENNGLVEIKTNIYPNPASEFIIISFNSMERADVTLFDLVGKTVSRQSIISGGMLDVSDLRTGTYILELRVGQSLSTSKIIVQ